MQIQLHQTLFYLEETLKQGEVFKFYFLIKTYGKSFIFKKVSIVILGIYEPYNCNC